MSRKYFMMFRIWYFICVFFAIIGLPLLYYKNDLYMLSLFISSMSGLFGTLYQVRYHVVMRQETIDLIKNFLNKNKNGNTVQRS